MLSVVIGMLFDGSWGGISFLEFFEDYYLGCYGVIILALLFTSLESDSLFCSLKMLISQIGIYVSTDKELHLGSTSTDWSFYSIFWICFYSYLFSRIFSTG